VGSSIHGDPRSTTAFAKASSFRAQATRTALCISPPLTHLRTGDDWRLHRIGHAALAEEIGMKIHHVQTGVGHYGVFNGQRWSNEIYPIVREVINVGG
jgi:PHB de-polymerase C-terminus